MTVQGKDRLGRGLGALLGDYLDESPRGEIKTLPVGSIIPNPFQPRRDFPEDELEELSASIRANGLLQPLVVRPAPKSTDQWELVAGERRLRAVSRLGWQDVPAMTREVDDETLLVLALVENLQRQELAPLEEAEGYQALADSFNLTQEEIARAVGKNRTTVTNMLRLLKLPPSVRKLLADSKLTMGHARALLGVDDPVRAGDLARKAVAEGWSVRQVEQRVRNAPLPTRKTNGGPAPASSGVDPVLRALQEELQAVLGTRVTLKQGANGKGLIEIPFYSRADFERIFAQVAGREASDVLQ